MLYIIKTLINYYPARKLLTHFPYIVQSRQEKDDELNRRMIYMVVVSRKVTFSNLPTLFIMTCEKVACRCRHSLNTTLDEVEKMSRQRNCPNTKGRNPLIPHRIETDRSPRRQPARKRTMTALSVVYFLPPNKSPNLTITSFYTIWQRRTPWRYGRLHRQ